MFWCADFFRFPFFLVAIIQLFNKLSSEDQQYKMFIKTLKAISSYVHHCVWNLFVPAALILWACLKEQNASFTQGIDAVSMISIPSPLPVGAFL